jgi:hypothetical protein
MSSLSAAAAAALLVAACRPDECRYQGQSYRLGASFLAADGCNSCSCAGNGKVACTARSCGTIDTPLDAGADAPDAARATPDGSGQDGAPDGAREAPSPAVPPTEASEDACGKALTVALGAAIVVRLASTYWQFVAPAAASVLHQQGSTDYAVGPNCPAMSIPGTGCGTATATFGAVGLGQAVIEAVRTSCGEALRCPPGQGSDQCTIAVMVVQ